MQTDPATLAEGLLAEAWATLAAGEGAEGLHLYDGGRFRLPWTCVQGFERWVLFRRSRRDPEKHAYYLVFAPTGTLRAELAGAAGLRWTIEECFQRAKDDLGLNHCEARSWHGWHRHMTLVMDVAAFLAKLAADLRRAAEAKQNERSPGLQIAASSPVSTCLLSSTSPPPCNGPSGNDDTTQTPHLHMIECEICSTRA